MLKPSLQLRLGQQLTMTPQLQQAIRLLQLPVMDLQSQIQEALESNVMLETEEPPEPQRNSEEAVNIEVAVLPEDTWRGSQAIGRVESPWSGSEQRPVQDFADHSNETLREHLLWQLELEGFSDRGQLIGSAIIDAINDDGYLIESLDNIQALVSSEQRYELGDIESALGKVQKLDPAGIGARSLSECLTLQLDQLDPQTPGLALARRIAAEHLDLVAEQQFAVLRRRLQVSDEELHDAVALVRACHPRPGSAIHSGAAEYVVPDVYVRKIDDTWVVELNSTGSPQLRVNQTYAGLLSRNSDHAVLRTQLQEARWLIRSLEIRNETLLKVAMGIIERQHEFLEKGEEYMRPMILRDIADAVEMHESTISRVTANKYMHTPRGVIEFRYFFSSHVTSTDGSEQSSTAIRAKIRKLIAQEDPGKPLSDNKLAQLLKQDGIDVARRTVAKYRESMGIATSTQRRQRS